MTHTWEWILKLGPIQTSWQIATVHWNVLIGHMIPLYYALPEWVWVSTRVWGWPGLANLTPLENKKWHKYSPIQTKFHQRFIHLSCTCLDQNHSWCLENYSTLVNTKCKHLILEPGVNMRMSCSHNTVYTLYQTRIPYITMVVPSCTSCTFCSKPKFKNN